MDCDSATLALLFPCCEFFEIHQEVKVERVRKGDAIPIGGRQKRRISACKAKKPPIHPETRHLERLPLQGRPLTYAALLAEKIAGSDKKRFAFTTSQRADSSSV